ncbi:MAG: sulfite exporter TauE/SafE family protein [Myxococcota bacterium]
MSPLEIAAVFAVTAAAGCIQASIGFGMALIAAPILVLIEPALVPGPLLASNLVAVSLMAVRNRAHVDFRTARFSMAGTVIGGITGASVLSLLDPQGFAMLFGLLVLLGVGLSLAGLRVAVNRGSTFGAGILGGFMSATSAIGGPPMALVHQHEEPERFRGTLATYFIVSCSVSLVALTWVGEFDLEKLSLTRYLIPGLVSGFLLAFVVARFLAGTSIRPFILGLSTLAGVVVLAKVFVS